MKFNINLTKEDFYPFQEYTTKRIENTAPFKWKITLFSVIFWCLLAIFAFQIYFVYNNDCCYNYTHLNNALIVLAILFLSVNIWQSIYLKLYINAAATDDGSVLGMWNFVVTEESITEYNDKCSSTFKWQCIKAVEKDSHNLYLFTDGVKALILPLSQINEEIESAINKNVISTSTLIP